MELINHRYRIIKELDDDSSYICSDIWDGKKLLKLNVIDQYAMSSSLKEYYVNEFIGISELDNDTIIKNYSFDIISEIDNKVNLEKQYLYTTEYIKKSISLGEYIENKDIFQIMEVFKEICKTIHYLHINGYVYGAVNSNNISIVKTGEEDCLKFKDIATVRLEQESMDGNDMKAICFELCEVLEIGPTDRRFDMYSIGVLLLTMIIKKPFTSSPNELIKRFKNSLLSDEMDFNKEETDFLLNIIPIIEKLISLGNEYPYRYLYEFVDEINEKTGKEYYIVDKENLQKLNLYTKLVDREDIVDSIERSYENMLEYRGNKKVYFIEGSSGMGKTRLLRELKFLLRLKGANTYSSFKLNNLNDDKEMWEEIFNRLMLSADKELVKKYKSDLKKIMPHISDFKKVESIEAFNDSSNKYKLLNRVARFIVDSLKDKPTVIIIDNIHLGNEFTMDILKYVYAEIKNDKNIILIFSYRENKMEDNKKFLQFTGSLRGRNDSAHFKLENLNIDESGKLIQNILTMDHVPKNLTAKIYSKAYGNPLFIVEIIKELYSNNRIFILQQSGLWHINLPEGAQDYEDLHIPNNLEQVLLNQLNEISKEDHMILNAISIAFHPINIEDLNNLLDIEKDVLESRVSNLLDKGILGRGYKNYKEIYEINNKVLNDIIYERISDDIKIKTHKAASESLEERMDGGQDVDLDELIYHLERSYNRAKLEKYLIKNSKEKYALRNITAAIKNLERAIHYVEEGDTKQRIRIVLRIAEMNLEIESISDCIKALEYVELLAGSLGDSKTELKVYVLKAEIYILRGDEKKFNYYLEKIANHLEKIEDFESLLWYKSFTAIMFLKAYKYEETIEICNEVIKLAGDGFVKIRGQVYRLLGLAYIRLNEFDRAIRLNEKSLELLKSIGYTRGVIYTLNNIGTIYQDNYQDLDKALEYYKKNIEVSKQHNILSGELLALTNTGGVLYEKFEYSSAFEYCETALKKALDANYKQDSIYLYRMLTKLSLNMNNFSQADEYYRASIRYSGEDEQLLNELKQIQAELFYTFGDFNKAMKYTEQSVEYLKDIRSTTKYRFSLRYCLIKIIVSDMEDYDCYMDEIISESNNIESREQRIIELSRIAQALWRKKDYKNSKKIVKAIEEFISDDLHDEAKSAYYFIKGVVTEGSESLEALNEGLKISSKRKNKLFISHIKMEIGHYYYKQEDYYNAVSYYISAAELIRNMIYDVPDKYRLTFVNNYQYGILFNRIKSLKAILLDNMPVGNLLEIKEESVRLNSLDDLSEFLSQDYNQFADDREFMKKYKENYVKALKSDVFDEKNIIGNLDNHIIGNLKLILNYLSSIVLSTNIAVVVLEQNNELSTIASIGENDDIAGNVYIFDRLKKSMKPILLSNRNDLNEYEENLLQGNLKASVYIPIASGYSQYYFNEGDESSKRNIPKIQGYLYLETSNTLNNFNQISFNENLGLINLIAILCEKYILRKIATIDKLTGALTRKYLEDALNDLVKSTSENNIKSSIIMYDLDRFKRVNDKFGHQTGDEVLQKVSKIVMENIGQHSSLGRYGGEEFVVILPDTDTKEAMEIANDLREKIFDAKILGELSPVSVSSGIATYPDHGTTSNQLIEKADQALYSAKENGRNRCEVWNKNIVSKIKPISKLDGIITGDDVRDDRNILAIVETIELMNSNLEENYIIDQYLVRILETLEGEYGYLIMVENDKTGEIGQVYEKKARQEEAMDHFTFNQDIVEDVIETKQAVYMIDWDYVRKDSLMAGLPIWNSVLAVPIIKKDKVKAIIYLLVSTNSKEFGIKDFNFANIYGNLFHL